MCGCGQKHRCLVSCRWPVRAGAPAPLERATPVAPPRGRHPAAAFRFRPAGTCSAFARRARSSVDGSAETGLPAAGPRMPGPACRAGPPATDTVPPPATRWWRHAPLALERAVLPFPAKAGNPDVDFPSSHWNTSCILLGPGRLRRRVPGRIPGEDTVACAPEFCSTGSWPVPLSCTPRAQCPRPRRTHGDTPSASRRSWGPVSCRLRPGWWGKGRPFPAHLPGGAAAFIPLR